LLNGTQAKLVAAGSTVAHANAQAHSMIYGTIQRQAAMMAFIDNFKMLGVVFFGMIPIFLLMRKPRVTAGTMPVH
jgi:DHA2 family multidrug resistance protein